jgi:hypothetical protein
VAYACKQTIPTERPPLAGEVSANFLWIEGVAWSAQRIPTADITIKICIFLKNHLMMGYLGRNML